MKQIEIYIHIPFCLRKCEYCDFLSSPANEDEREKYVQALVREIEQAGTSGDERVGYDPREYLVSSVYIGGGTPSILDGEQIFRIMSAVRKTFRIMPGAEVTSEVNPGAVDIKKLSRFRFAGINRISIGLQSADDADLKLLGRIHTVKDFEESYRLVREAGFKNVSVDLIHSLPGQSVGDWEKSLRYLAELGPEHISAYSLIIEEGTPFYERFGDIAGEERVNSVAGECSEKYTEPVLPSEEEDRLMDEMTEKILSEYGYEQYEISNYARPGYSCIHNMGYWSGVYYIGFGLGSSSYLNEVRFANTSDMEEYIKSVGADGCASKCEVQILTENERKEEFFFLGLRRREGITLEEYEARFGETWEAYVPAMDRMTESGFMEKFSGGYRLTRAGIDVSNTVFAEILI